MLSNMERVFLVLGAVSAGLAVAAGAFAAHGLRQRLSPEMLAVFETGVRYHMYHALGLLAVARLAALGPGRAMRVAGWLFVAGTLLFSGSLYGLAVSGQRWLGAITPLGGVCFVAGWLVLAWAGARG